MPMACWAPDNEVEKKEEETGAEDADAAAEAVAAEAADMLADWLFTKIRAYNRRWFIRRSLDLCITFFQYAERWSALVLANTFLT